jgi:phosphoribosylformimino-5-aminoimidazole carboxamide ribotide isomerase
MLIIPAIDLKDGKCVRLLQGDYSRETIYADKPEQLTCQFETAGARWLHVVDLNGAQNGQLVNLPAIQAIVANTSIPIQLGGGIRSLEIIGQLLQLGIGRVVLGTLAFQKPELVGAAIERFGAEKIAVGIDARSGQVAIAGWQQITAMNEVTLAQQMQSLGVQRIIYTDISRDGMLTGPNLSALKHMARSTGLAITASGGVASLTDLEHLKSLEPDGVDSVIIGKAIYENRFDLPTLFSQF